MIPAIEVRGLRKSYGDLEAVRGIDFEVQQGEVFGLLGPNGAGKTTTVEILEGLRPRSAGDVKVLGHDPAVNVRQLKDRIGVCLQATNLPEKMTVLEAVQLFSAFYTKTADPKRLLERLQLWEKRNAFYTTLSGGQKQRVALALAMVNEPQLVFLDEPTTGLDPQVRLEIHGLIQELRNANSSIVITTHYIEEAERLCDRVAIVDAGKIIEIGTPREIQQRVLGDSIVELKTAADVALELPVFAEQSRSAVDGRTITIHTRKPAKTLVEAVKWVDSQGIEIDDVRLKHPTLEDVFIELTGKKLRE